MYELIVVHVLKSVVSCNEVEFSHCHVFHDEKSKPMRSSN